MDLYEQGLADAHTLADDPVALFQVRKDLARHQREKIARADEEIARAQASRSYALGVLFGLGFRLDDDNDDKEN